MLFTKILRSVDTAVLESIRDMEPPKHESCFPQKVGYLFQLLKLRKNCGKKCWWKKFVGGKKICLKTNSGEQIG